MRIEIHQEDNAMRNGSKNKRYSFITFVSVCFSLWAFVFPIPIYAAGEVAAWGYNGWGQCFVPEPNTGFVAIAAGGYHSLGLKQNGSIVAWGDNMWGQCTVPEPNMDFVAIAAGGYHSLGLKQNGSIVAWGYNGSLQCTVPEPNTGFVAIAAGRKYSLGLKSCPYNLDGDLYNDCKVGFHDLAVLADHWLIEKLSFDIAPGTGDGIVNFIDWAVFANGWQGDMVQLSEFISQWLQPSDYNADIAPAPNGDGIVNMLDFATMANNWLVDCFEEPSNPACVPK